MTRTVVGRRPAEIRAARIPAYTTTGEPPRPPGPDERKTYPVSRAWRL